VLVVAAAAAMGSGVRYRVPVLRQYFREVPVTRRCFDASLDSSDQVWAAEATRHPAFRLEHASR
jgi:hypothetical protein